ncbi:FAD-binding oxidoreductase [Acuticoccus sp. M5D2P5]|uniref:NAD(P)/FAD-dependent oxidoreductase n=1 Tax=Acuticoccus kalidii TaxID=2910977 RepID=UPI001F2DBF82|nr:FAD-binding oxidoreductase [Acuticoccus kalidii]MCF3932215.1 FAD-binding oxidoreductase [Acuticoccus kalidii]
MAFPTSARFVIIGAGIHGLSTALHLARGLKARQAGTGADILVIDKGGIAAGASGIACGVVRNNYFQPAMRELMAHSVALWEENREALHYNPVGYMQISPEAMHGDVAAIHAEQQAIGYESTFVEGEADSARYMRGLFDDWQAKGITSVLHEKRGGYAHNAAAICGLAGMAEAEGVRILTGVTVKGFTFGHNSDAIVAVETDRGRIECGEIVVAPGPWVRDFWAMLDLPGRITVRDATGEDIDDVPMWRFWQLEEGVLGVPLSDFRTNEGQAPPVLHVDSDAPLVSDVDGSLITEEMWGIYYKPDPQFGGIQGGASPYPVEGDADTVALDPYGPASPEFVSSPEFAHMWASALAHCHKRFEGMSHRYKREPSGGLGCFTPDSFPVFDRMRPNAYMIADSNHGYKMLGVGQLVACELLGEPSALLAPFRFDRYAAGALHPVSHSPFPWS